MNFAEMHVQETSRNCVAFVRCAVFFAVLSDALLNREESFQVSQSILFESYIVDGINYGYADLRRPNASVSIQPN